MIEESKFFHDIFGDVASFSTARQKWEKKINMKLSL